MRPSNTVLYQIIPRSALRVEPKKIKILPVLTPQVKETKTHTLIDVLMERQIKAGPTWPANIRIEPVVKKEAFKLVQSDVRTRLKNLLKER